MLPQVTDFHSNNYILIYVYSGFFFPMKWKKQNQNNSDAIFYVISRYKAKLSCEK